MGKILCILLYDRERHCVLLRSGIKVIIFNTARNNLIWTYIFFILGKICHLHLTETGALYLFFSNLNTNVHKENETGEMLRRLKYFSITRWYLQ